MSIEIHSVASLRALSEVTFGADGTSSPGLGSYTYVPMNEGSGTFTLITDSLDPLPVVQQRGEYRKEVLGKRSATLNFTMDLAPTGTAAGSAVAAVSGALGLLLKATMGGEHLGTGTTAGVGSSASVIVCASSAGLLAGDMVGWANTSGIVEWRQIEVVTDSTHFTTTHAFSGSPANSNPLYAAANYYFTEDPVESLQFLVAGAESDDRFLLVGGQCTGGFTLAIDPTGAAIPTITFNFTFSWFFMSDETAGTVTGAIATATYTNYSPIVGNAGECRMFTVGSATLDATSLVHCSALSIAPKIVFVPVPSPSGANGGGVLRYRGGRQLPPVEASITTYYDATTWFDVRDARTDKDLSYVAGVAAGSALVLAVPTGQVVNPQRVAAGEIASQTFGLKGRRNTDTGVSTTDLAKSAFVLALG